MDLTRYELMCTGPDGTTDLCRLVGCTMDMAVSDDPDDNDFTLSCPVSGAVPEVGATVYVEGTEIGGTVEGRGTDSAAACVEVVGRTWSGLLDARVVRPPAGQDYLPYSGDARAVLRQVVSGCSLGDVFSVPSGSCGTSMSGRFDRYCTAWEGLRKELRRVGLRPSATWDGMRWVLDAVPRRTVEVDSRDARVTSDAGLRPYNHLVCAGEGELKDRVVVDLYADAAGRVSQTQTLTGALERAALYDRSGSDAEELVKDGTEKLQELQATPTLSVDLSGLSVSADVGDVVRVVDDDGGTEVEAEVTRVVAKVGDDALRVTVEGGNTRQTRSLTGSSEAETASVLPIPSGGTGAETRRGALDNLAFLGVNPTTADGDTREAWAAMGTGYAWYNATGRLQGQPSQWGFLVSLANGNELDQLFVASGGTLNLYLRKANASTGTMPVWRRVFDSGTLTGNTGLIHAMFDNNLTSGTLCFPVFTAAWADGGYMNDTQLRAYLAADTGWRKLAGTYDTPVGHEGTNGLYYRKTGQTVSVYVNGGGSWGPAITTAGVVLGTLPAGCRPNAMLAFTLAPKGAGAHRLEIHPNGQIKGVASSGSTSYYVATPCFTV